MRHRMAQSSWGWSMSYRRSYNTSISLSGSETVSYPASEHGGTTTAYWQHTEPISIDITVDTEPFDSSVQSCNGHVLALGAAVGVMNTAQCAAIQQGAAQVSASLQKGFFGTIKTELGAQMRSEERRVGKECRSRWSPYH